MPANSPYSQPRRIRVRTYDPRVLSDHLDFEPGEAFDRLVGALIHYRIAIGPNAGRKALTLRTVTVQPEPFPSTSLARLPGFSLHAATVCAAAQRDKLEKLCRYIARPAIANERLSTNERGQLIYRFKPPFRDGSTHVVLEPLDFIARLAALVPRPRLNLTRFHGVFAPNCKHRESVVPKRKPRHEKPDKPLAPMTPMQRLKGGAGRRSNRVGQALPMAATTARRDHSVIGAAHRRRLARMDTAKAVKATAHQLARLIYHMLTRGEEYVARDIAASARPGGAGPAGERVGSVAGIRL